MFFPKPQPFLTQLGDSGNMMLFSCCLWGNLSGGVNSDSESSSSNTPRKAVFAGSMQLLAGVKLCTGRTLTNHPHYEDNSLRERTKAVRAHGFWGASSGLLSCVCCQGQSDLKATGPYLLSLPCPPHPLKATYIFLWIKITRETAWDVQKRPFKNRTLRAFELGKEKE